MYIHPDAMEFLCESIIQIAVEDIRNAPAERYKGTSYSAKSRRNIAERNGEDARSFFLGKNGSLFPLMCPNMDGEYIIYLAEKR